MSQQTFYRKYRSQSFGELIGQDHIKQTLSNAISNDRLSHAYIFSGPRGTGKTSTARILAKSINCREGASVTPCQTCDICTQITSGHSVDVVEIDAASHTGVDHIRDLNDRVHFQPVVCKTKLYIIDEVHMLSTGAFNALLKTLEEPPSHTIFVLATTEPHKIPATIHSRCQHLYFRNLTAQELVSHLKTIADHESISVDDAGLFAIARNSSGCMRDAISLLNQVYSFKGSSITADDIQLILGSTNDQALFTLVETILKQDDAAFLEQLQKLFNEGAHAAQLVTEMLTIVRQLLYISLKLDDQLDGDTSRHSSYEKLATVADIPFLNRFLQKLAETELDLRWFSRPDLLIQIRCLELFHQPEETSSNTAAQPAAQPPRNVVTQPLSQSMQRPPAQTQRDPEPAPPARPTTPLQPKTQPTAQAEKKVSIPVPSQPNKPASSLDPSTQAYKKSWDGVLELIKKQKTALYSILKQSVISDVNGKDVTLRLKQDFKFFRDKLKEQSNKSFIEQCLTQITGNPCTLWLEGDQKPTDSRHSSVNGTSESSTPQEKRAPSKKINDIVAMFEGTVL